MGTKRRLQVDVLVVGGGPAGLGAAISAARNGARVLLVEHQGFLGGTITQALVIGLLTQYAGDQRVIGGIPQELTDHLLKAGAAKRLRIPMSTAAHVVVERVEADPEMFKLAADEFVQDSGAELWLHSYGVEALVEDNTVHGAVVLTKSGQFEVSAKVTIDTTGDGDVAFSAGAIYEQGSVANKTLQPMSMNFRAGNVNVATAFDFWKSEDRRKMMRAACERGELPVENMAFHAPGWAREVVLGMTRVTGRDPLNVSDLTAAEKEGRLQVQKVMAFLVRNFPGFEEAYLAGTGSSIGIRETRRIMGDYVLTGDDVMTAKHFEDGIARGSYPIDMHPSDKTNITFVPLPQGQFYDIPYRCLLPRGLERILVAGRCLSATREAFASARVAMICMAMGQAAGAAAAMAAKQNLTPRQIDPKELREDLRTRGVLC